MDGKAPIFENLTITRPSRVQGVYVLTMDNAPENRLTVSFAQTLIRALRHIETVLLKSGDAGAVIISSFSDKFWTTGLDLQEADENIYASSDGFYPLLATLLDYPYPTVALITGHTFGGACPFALACDYRIMNSKRGFFCMPPVDLGLHFDGIGALPRLKTSPQVARKMLLEAYRWTATEALADGIVDEIAPPEEMRERAEQLAARHAVHAKKGVYGMLRAELWGEALEKLNTISYVHRKKIGIIGKAHL